MIQLDSMHHLVKTTNDGKGKKQSWTAELVFDKSHHDLNFECQFFAYGESEQEAKKNLERALLAALSRITDFLSHHEQDKSNATTEGQQS